MTAPSRTGVALIIAISVLAALLFLALPFLYSQSASVAGARSAAYDGEARRGQGTAGGVAAGLAVYAHGLHLSREYAATTHLGAAMLTYGQPAQVRSETRHPAYDGSDPGRISMRFDLPWTQPDTTQPILSSVRDGTVSHGAQLSDQSLVSARLDPLSMSAEAWAKLFRMTGVYDPVTVEAESWLGNQSVKWRKSGRGIGRLAYGFEYTIHDRGGINQLEELCGIEPRVIPITIQSPYQLPPNSQRDAAEIDPAVKGPTDLGFRADRLSLTQLELLRPFLSATTTAGLVPAQARSGWIDLGNVVEVSGSLCVLDANQPYMLVPGDRILGGLSGARGWVTGADAGRMYVTTKGGPFVGSEPLAIAAVPAININALPADQPLVRWFKDFWDTTSKFQATIAKDYGWPSDPVADPILSLAGIPSLHLLDPRGGDGQSRYLRPSVGVTNWGVIAIDSAATARDAQGRIQSSRRQRTVVQAVPQEHPIEATWQTQAEFESLVRQRHGSWMVAGPHPTNRVASWGIDKNEREKLDKPDGWLESMPLASFSRNPAVSFDWKNTFGLDTTASSLQGVVGKAKAHSIDDMKADGLHGGGYFTMADSPFMPVASGPAWELPSRHISMRFKIGKITNAKLALVDAQASTGPAAWRVYYDATQATGMTALVLETDNGSGHPVQFWYRASLEANRWYHLQVYQSADQPEYQGIILDGIVGRDVTGGPSFDQTGDHYTWPSFRLADEITENGASGNIELLQPPGPAPGFVLPLKGLIRINDEYFHYDSRDGMTLKDVERGYRCATAAEATTSNGGPDINKRYPVRQRHPAGSLVVPGWTQVQIEAGSNRVWHRGKAELEQELPDDLLPIYSDFTDRPDVLTVPDDWPERGEILFSNMIGVAFTKTGSAATLLWSSPASGWSMASWAQVRTLAVDTVAGFPSEGWVQLTLGATTEWVRYEGVTEIASGPAAGSYLVNATGWGQNSAASPITRTRGAHGTAVFAWTKGATVLPVQTGVAVGPNAASTSYPGTHRLESGDECWLIADNGTEMMVKIRHAAHDYTDAARGWSDVTDGLIAFDEQLPNAAVFPDPHELGQSLVVGAGWVGDDLSPTVGVPVRRGRGPRYPDMPQFHFGQAATGSPLQDPEGIVIDDLCAGPMPDARLPLSQQLAVTGFSEIGKELKAGDELPVSVLMNQQVFTRQYGLLSIDGEVFVYRRGQSQNQATLIARGLLGSANRNLNLGSSDRSVMGRLVNPMLPAVLLPMGPVGEICGSGSIDWDQPLDLLEGPYEEHYRDLLAPAPNQEYGSKTSQLDSVPALLIAHPMDGVTVEAMRIVAQTSGVQHVTAPWLRGLYGSAKFGGWECGYDPASDWRTAGLTWATWGADAGAAAEQQQGDLNPVVIGWWPRFAPAMPSVPTPQHLRSRSYGWAGFSLRLHGSRFDPTIPALAGGVADIRIEDFVDCDVSAVAMATGPALGQMFDWENSPALPLTVADTTITGSPFVGWSATERFVGREVDGAELRLTWSVPTTKTGLDAIADAQGRAPRIGTVRLRCVAPTRILSVEEVR